ncbi:MAG: transglycosylase SLT domain-containing protein [Candidatus Magasanikbacteria bacterium]|jgi:hypothetical protein
MSDISRRNFLESIGNVVKVATGAAIFGEAIKSTEAEALEIPPRPSSSGTSKVDSFKKSDETIETAPEKENFGGEFLDDVLMSEIEHIADDFDEPERSRLLEDAKKIFQEMDAWIYSKRLTGHGQEEKYFSDMLKKWDHCFPVIVKACQDKEGNRNEELEGVLVSIICGESAMKHDEKNRGKDWGAGYYQIEKPTALEWGLRVDEEVDERFDFKKTTAIVTRYIRREYAKYGQWGLAMMAFGKGDGGLRKIIRENFKITDPNPENLLSKKVNIVSIYNKTKNNPHTFTKAVLARRFKIILEKHQNSKK